MSKVRKLKAVTLLGLASAVLMSMAAHEAKAAKQGKPAMFNSSETETHAPSRKGSSMDMMFDLSVNYVRDTSPTGTSDTAGKFSLGGMFNNWIGLDLMGLYQAKTKNFLVGTDLRIVPTDWFFLKGGIGGYSEKATNQFKATPLVGTGIIARVDRDFYFLAETNYFQVDGHNNLSLGVGAGVMF